jgi:hypothetical protein
MIMLETDKNYYLLNVENNHSAEATLIGKHAIICRVFLILG